jgi:hypothetical protein
MSSMIEGKYEATIPHLLGTTLFTASARLEEFKAGNLVISQAWSRATPNCSCKLGGHYEAALDHGHAAPAADATRF